MSIIPKIKGKLFEIATIGLIVTVIFFVISFVLIFVSASTATVFAIFTSGFLITSSIFLVAYVLVKTIDPNAIKEE